ncbi:MAG: hypothetical protein OEW06_00820 [Gemmatimonadota bacterium]|nr:hypothetical protein [Gemmatimonadota bacterium]MDH4350510.1 hypothetical protein [Gemmatimonadota bacterium]
MAQVLTIVLVLAGAGVAVWVGYQQAAKRREALRGIALSMGLDFRAADDHDFDSYHRHGPFQQGQRRHAYNRIFGTVPIEGETFALTMGDYQYTVRRGKHHETHRFSFALFGLPWGGVPHLAIRREHIGDKVLGAIGFDDIDFESEEFSRRFYVQSNNKRFAYAVVDPRMMEFLMHADPPKIDITDGECLVYVSERRRWKPDEFRRHFAWARQFFSQWPEHVRREFGGRRPGTVG